MTKAKGSKSAKAPALRLDLGCGRNKREGFVGVDILALPGVDRRLDLRKRWPWGAGSVAEIHCANLLGYLTAPERCHVANEMHRVLEPGGKATVSVPYWGSGRAYGDPLLQWPPMSEMWFFHLSAKWRDENAPHTSDLLGCDFDATWGYGLHPSLHVRSQEWQQFAVSYYREAVMDIVATLTKK